MKAMWVLVAGLAMAVIGLEVGIATPLVTQKDPSVEAVTSVKFNFFDESEAVYLPRGVYDIWYYAPPLSLYPTPGYIRVYDMNQSKIFTSSASTVTDSITINDREYKKRGSFSVEESGQYIINVEEFFGTLYLTPPIYAEAGRAISFGSFVVAAVGFVVLLAGFVLHSLQKRSRLKAYLRKMHRKMNAPEAPEQ